jgi:DNA-binding response OmpR family regulator
VYTKNWKDVDLVILDLVMPQMSARDLFTRLRTINPGVKVLLASGYSINGEAHKILELGADGFIQKPFSIAELTQNINEIV